LILHEKELVYILLFKKKDKMRKLSILLLFLFNIINAQTNINAGKVAGLWVASHSPYIILGDIQIDTTKQLRIEPGVEVRFNGNYKLTVLGRLLVEGTVTDSVKFTAADTSIGWGGIRFIDTDNNLLDSSKIMYALFSYGRAKNGSNEEKSGGAIYIKNSSRLGIYNSKFYLNNSYAASPYGGGAIYIDNSNCIIHYCDFLNNFAINCDAGALFIYNSGINLRNSTFNSNSAKSNGGAIKLAGNKGNLLRNIDIIENKATNGGGIYLNKTLFSNENFDISLINISENHATNWGGGIYIDTKIDPNLPIRNIRISNNTAEKEGSAIAAFKEVYFQNCIIDHNNKGNSTFSVHPIFIMPIQMNFLNCVIADNQGSPLIVSYGESGDFGNLYITNSIIWHNEGGIDPPNGGGYIYVSYSTVQYPWNSFTMGQGVNHKAPEFKNHSTGNYHLSNDSPAIDKGSPEPIFNDYILNSLAGLGTVRNDLGAYGGRLNAWRDSPVANFIAYNRHGEAPLTVQFKNLALNDPLEFAWDFNNDGVYDSNEKNPTYTYQTPGIYSVKLKVNSFEFMDTITFKDYIVVRQNGLSGAVSGIWDLDTMKILGDIYIPQDSTLVIAPGTNVYFTGNYKFNVYGTLLAEGTEENKIFFFSDSLGETNNYPFYNGQWGGINFLNTQTNNQIPSVLKNCSIRYGFETWIDELSDILGGGIVLYKSKLSLENVTIDSCYGKKGGGIHVNESLLNANNLTIKDIRSDNGLYSYNSRLNIRNSLFRKNSGCGIYAENGNIYIANSVADSNINTYGKGSGLYATGSSVYILNSEFNFNHSGNAPGGGISISSAPETFLEKVKVKHNFSSSEGGGINFVATNPILTNVEIAFNSADYTGGGISFGNIGNGQIHRYADIDNCLIYKNETRNTYGTGAAIAMGMNCHVNITNTTITDNTAKDFSAIANTWGTGIANVTNSIIFNNGANYDLQVQGDNSKYTYSLIQGFYNG
jgi:PKD repeat protein